MTRTQIAELVSLIEPHATFDVLDEIAVERAKQDRRFGRQDLIGETGGVVRDVRLALARTTYEKASVAGGGPGAGWAEILDEEVCEALAEVNRARLRAELVQVAACAVGFIEAIDREARK